MEVKRKGKEDASLLNKEVGYHGIEIPSSLNKMILLLYYKARSPFGKGKGLFNLKEDCNDESTS